MASTMTLGYPQAVGSTGGPHAAQQHSSASRFPQYQYSADISAPASPRLRDFLLYEKPIQDSLGHARTGQPATAAALAATQSTSPHGLPRTSFSQTSRTESRRGSLPRSRTAPMCSSSIPDDGLPKTPWSRTGSAKDRFKSNLKRIAQQKEGDTTTLDLSITAEENEKRSGMGIYNRQPASRSATDVRFTPTGSRPRNNTFANPADLTSFKPSVPFLAGIGSESHPPSPRNAHLSYTSSAAEDSVYSGGDAYSGTFRPSLHDSRRPSLRLHTDSELGSISSHRARRNTNQSVGPDSVSSPPTSKSRKSFDKAFSILSRKDSNATVDILDESTRAASIRAARLAFDQRQEMKDAKYEKRAAKDRERKEKKERSRSFGQDRRPSQLQQETRSTIIEEKTGASVQGKEYSELPVPSLSGRQSAALRKASERTKISRTRRLKTKYAWFLSWLRTKLLNVARRQRH